MLNGPIALGTIRTSFVLTLRLAIQAGTLLLVARMLGPEQFGAFAGVAAIAVMLGTLSSFGTHLILLAEMSKETSRRDQVLIYAIPMTIVGGSILLLVFLLVCQIVLPNSKVSLGALVAIGAAELLLLPLFGLVVSELLARGRTAHSQLLQTLPLAFRPAAAAMVLVLQLSPQLTYYASAYLLATTIAFAVVMACLPVPWPGPRQWCRPSLGEIRASASYAALNITALGPAELDKTLAMKFLPLHAAGLYAASARVVGAVTLPVVALMLSALPRLFRESQQSQRTARLLGWIYGVTLTYSMFLAVTLWVCAPVFARLLGSGYEGVEDVIRWLCPVIPGMALRIAAGSALMALGRPWVRAGFEVVGLLVLVLAATILTEHVGTKGMPLALACSEWTMALWGSWLIARVRRKA
ncbi:MAG: oligosaccharide flippase family protein [Pseudomonas sp.]|nr:oligosaccharide flippase family protein [Pseudomonas sp.]